MRIEPDQGQDIPTECSSAKITTGDLAVQVVDKGSYLELRLEYAGGSVPGIIIQPQAGNVIRLSKGRIA